MVDLVLYYQLVEKLLIVTGKWVRIYSLFADLKGKYEEFGAPSKDSSKVFKEKYHGSFEELMEVGNVYYKDSLKDWKELRRHLITHEVYDCEDATDFTDYIQYRNRTCNFRRMALRWTRDILKKLENGEDVEFYSLHDYVTSYRYYERERLKGGHRFKGLHKQV